MTIVGPRSRRQRGDLLDEVHGALLGR